MMDIIEHVRKELSVEYGNMPLEFIREDINSLYYRSCDNYNTLFRVDKIGYYPLYQYNEYGNKYNYQFDLLYWMNDNEGNEE